MRFYHMLNDHLVEAPANVVGAPRDGSQRPWNRGQCTNPGAAHAGEAQSHARNKVKVTPVFASHCTACKQTSPPSRGESKPQPARTGAPDPGATVQIPPV